MENKTVSQTEVITKEELLDHWQGHRRLTRKIIEAFPKDKLFEYSIGGMRPFADMARELIGIAGMGIHGITRGDWNTPSELNYHSETSALTVAGTKEELLRFWDKATEMIDTHWPEIPESRFRPMQLSVSTKVRSGRISSISSKMKIITVDRDMYICGRWG